MVIHFTTIFVVNEYACFHLFGINVNQRRNRNDELALNYSSLCITFTYTFNLNLYTVLIMHACQNGEVCLTLGKE